MSKATTTTRKGQNAVPAKVERDFLMSRHAPAGAAIASFLAAFWVMQYLGGILTGLPLSAIVLGQISGIEAAGAEALFVVVTRFIVGFGLSWGPITAIIAAVQRNRKPDSTH